MPNLYFTEIPSYLFKNTAVFISHTSWIFHMFLPLLGILSSGLRIGAKCLQLSSLRLKVFGFWSLPIFCQKNLLYCFLYFLYLIYWFLYFFKKDCLFFCLISSLYHDSLTHFLHFLHLLLHLSEMYSEWPTFSSLEIKNYTGLFVSPVPSTVLDICKVQIKHFWNKIEKDRKNEKK